MMRIEIGAHTKHLITEHIKTKHIVTKHIHDKIYQNTKHIKT